MTETPFHALFDGSEQLFWPYLLASALVALALSLGSGKGLSLGRLRAWLLGADARLDIQYFFVNWLLRTLLIVPFVLSLQTVALWTLHGLNRIADPLFLPWRYRHIVLAYTLALFVLNDFSRYWLHRLMHRNRWLWLFHRVHHDAETLNPLLLYRIHPVESFLFALRYALVTGVVTGVFVFCFGARLDVYTIFGDNVFVVLLFSFASNLRHSHVRLGYGSWLERVLISPAQHQIHHDRRHLQSNLGSCLAVWDWMFGTLKLSREVPEAFSFGLGSGDRRRYSSVASVLAGPFVDIHDRVRRRRR